MSEFCVTIPITGILRFTIEAEDKESAIKQAMHRDWSVDDIEECDSFHQIVTGNVFHGHTNKATAEEV